MKTGHLINSVIAVFLIFIAGNQFLHAGSLTPSAGTVAPTMKSLEQIYEQQRFAAFAGGTVRGGPGLVTSSSPTGTGVFLGQVRIETVNLISGPVLSIQNLGDCDVRIDSTNTLNANTPTFTVPAGQSYAESRLIAASVREVDGQATYTFLGGTDCQFMWVIR